MIRSSKQDHTCLYLHDILEKNIFLTLNNYFWILEIITLTTRTDDYFLRKKNKHDEQIVMYYEQNIEHHKHLIV